MVAAAARVFMRYGYAKTTVAELADAAELSRPSLYEMFSGKDALFAAVVHRMSNETLQEFRKASPRLRTLRSKLHSFCGELATHGSKLAKQHPDAKDLFDLKFPVVREMYENFILFLIEVISAEPYVSRLPLAKAVRNLVFSFRGLKETARDVEHMEELVKLQVDMFLMTLLPAA